MADFAAQIRELQADFQRIADRVPDARLCFVVRGRTLGIAEIGRASACTGVDSGSGSILTCECEARCEAFLLPYENPIYAELSLLTNQAGSLVLDIFRSNRCEVTHKFADFDLRKPAYAWFVYLLFTPPVCLLCWACGSGGNRLSAWIMIGESPSTTVWIDNFPQLSVTALSILKAKLSAIPSIGPTDSQPPSPPIAGVQLKPDQFDLGKGAIVSDVSPKQLMLLALLKPAGVVGVDECAVCQHLGYESNQKGTKALAQLASRTNETLSDCPIRGVGA